MLFQCLRYPYFTANRSLNDPIYNGSLYPFFHVAFDIATLNCISVTFRYGATMTEVSTLTWKLEQLNKLTRQQPNLLNRAVQRMLDEDQDLRWAMVVSAYLDAEISLAKAAELLGVHALELRNRFTRLGIPLRLGPVNIDEAKAEAAAALN